MLTLIVGFILVLIIECYSSNDLNGTNYLPVVIWHGLGDYCCDPASVNIRIRDLIRENLPGTHVHLLRIGDTPFNQASNAYFLPVSNQIEMACKQIAEDPLLQNGYNAIGISQGGQFTRGLLQRCPTPAMKVLITLGSQHQGVHNIPSCPNLAKLQCKNVQRMLKFAAYSRLAQRLSVQATYWHDPNNEVMYRKRSEFLADINNENYINKDYVRNLQSLSKFVMVKFNRDSIVIPVESSWFSWYKRKKRGEIIPLNQTYLYLENRLGLRKMDEMEKLVFLEYDGDHIEFTDKWFIHSIIPYLRLLK